MLRCKLDNCPVSKDGRCLEGREASSCPNLIVEAETSPAEPLLPSVPAAKGAQPVFDSLPKVLPLEISEARIFARRGRAIVVALAGMPDCGKTSLLARLHQLFQAGPLSGFDFAGCRSLPHFEELNWLATVESCVQQPKMPHSSAQFDNSLLHLAVRHTVSSPRVDLLLNDIAGETFERAVAAQSACERLLLLSRADHLVVLADGAALADPARTHHHVAQVHDFLQRVIQSGQCGVRTALHLVVSKLDKLGGNTSVADRLEASIKASFMEKFGSISCCRVAARPMDGSLPTVQPITNLFTSWVNTTHRYPMPLLPSVSRSVWARDYCRYGS